MRKIFKSCIGLVFMASLIVTPTIGQTTMEPAVNDPVTQDMTAQTVTVNGTVKAVSASSLTIVDDQKAEHTIALDAKTKVMKAGKAATTADLKANDAVVVVANKGEGNALTAVSVTAS